MNALRSSYHSTGPLRPALLIIVCVVAGLWPEAASALTITDRVMPVYNRGDVHFSCLRVDGGDVPINAPPNASLAVAGGEISFHWGENAVATIKSASASESSLIDETGKPQEQAIWESAVLTQIDRSAQVKVFHDFAPNILPVNHWKMGAISYDYQLGGAKWTTLLLVWRCLDGTTISVKLFAHAKNFEEVRTGLYQIIGGALLLKN